MFSRSLSSNRSSAVFAFQGCCVSVFLFLSCVFVHAQADLTVKPVVYASHAAKEGCLMNMGPTGAKAWMRGYQFVVMSIDQGSPSHGVLMLKDVVTAADGITFGPTNDSRITLGNAIGRAEADGKPLRLTVQRAGKMVDVDITLPKLGTFSPTWPSTCDKSARILDAACRTLVQAQLPDGRIISDGSIGTYLGGLLLLASGDARFFDAARRAAYAEAAKDHTNGSLNNWNAAYGGLLLAEYYLSTGDDTVLAALKQRCDQLERGQMACGAWGHTTPHGAYGALNQVGVICTLTLVLADECGVDVNPEAKKKAVDFFARFAERGAVPYGDSFPYMSGLDSNGRNASCALVMKLAGRMKEARALASSVAMSYWEREEGHTGGFFSLTWGPLGVALAGEEEFRKFMDYQTWHYNLMHNWKGELVHIPYYEALTRFDSNTYVYFGGDFTTGGFGLAYALPKTHLRITGAPQSIFAATSTPKGKLGQARAHYLAKEWKQCDALLSKITGADLESHDVTYWLKQLKDARALSKASMDQTLLEVESNILEGAPYRASEQFNALTRAVGSDMDPRFETVKTQLAGQAYGIGQGKKVYDTWAQVRVYSFMSWIPQGDRIKTHIAPLPSLRGPIWEVLSPISQTTPQTWKTLRLGTPDDLPKDWHALDFDDSSWKSAEKVQTVYVDESEELKKLDGRQLRAVGNKPIAARRTFMVDNPKGVALKLRMQTVRSAFTKVYLNGQLILNTVRGQRGGYASIQLDSSVLKVLRKGKNVLAVTCDKQGPRNNSLDVGLYINRESVETRTLPTDRVTALTLDDVTADATLRVRETKDKMKKAFADAIMAKDIPTLLKELKQPVGAYRHMIERALAKKGVSGLKAVAPLATADDWKLRSAYCEVVRSIAYDGFKKEKPGDDHALTEAEKTALVAAAELQISTVVKLLDDPNFWVRMRAVSSLASCGVKARVAVPKITTMINDPDPWVRSTVVSAIDRLQPDPAARVAAAVQALKVQNSSFAVSQRAMRILQKHLDIKTGKLDAVVVFLKHPPQGGGGGILKPYMELGMSLDPDGTVMVPVLVDGIVGKPGFGQQQGNARGAAVQNLVKYGDKAKSAIPTLKAFMSSDARDDKERRKHVIEALQALGEDVSEYESKAEKK